MYDKYHFLNIETRFSCSMIWVIEDTHTHTQTHTHTHIYMYVWSMISTADLKNCILNKYVYVIKLYKKSSISNIFHLHIVIRINFQYSFVIKRTGQITNDWSSTHTSYLVTLVNGVSHESVFLLRHGIYTPPKKRRKILSRLILELKKTMQKSKLPISFCLVMSFT